MGFPSTDGTSNFSGSGEYSAQPLEMQYTGSSTETSAINVSPDAVRCPKCGMDVPRIARNCPNDGTDLLLREGQVFADKYELLAVVGSGAMGVIYKARHLILEKLVAIKVLHTNNADSNLIMRFQREAKAASSLNHINVITVYDFGVHCGTAPYMVMDYLHGRTLDKFIEARGQLSLRETLDIADQVLSALSHAQKKNILHRDLKPSNIMVLEEEGEPRLIKILDFGLAKLLDREDQVTLSAVGTALGSPAYMSPEQATGLKVDARSDLYSLGCMMFEIIAGQPPLLGESPMETLMNRLNQRVPSLRDAIKSSSESSASTRSRAYNPLQEIPTIVELFVAKLLERDQRDRFQSAQEAREYLNTIWEYVDDDAQDQASTRSSRRTTSHSRVTVKDISVADINREAQMRRASSESSDALFSSTAFDAQRTNAQLAANDEMKNSTAAKPTKTHDGLRKIQKEKSTPVSPAQGSGIGFYFSETYRYFERFANQIADMTHSLERSNPELYRIAIALAVIALIVVFMILR